MAKTDEKVLAVVEQELLKNPNATLDELWDKAKEENSSVGKLDRRQFNARYPLQVKRRLQFQAAAEANSGGPKKTRKRRKAKAVEATPEAAPPRRRGRPKGSGARKAMAPEQPAASSGNREGVRNALLNFASDVVNAADSPKTLVKLLAGVDRYVDRVMNA